MRYIGLFMIFCVPSKVNYLLLMAIFSISCLAANVEIESETNIQAYIDDAKNIQKTNPRLAYKMLDKAYSLAKSQSKPLIAGRALLEYAQTAKLNKRYLLAQQYLIRAEAVSTPLKDKALSVDILTNMSTVQRYLKDYDKSMAYVQRGLVIAHESHEPLLILKCLQSKGALLDKMKHYEKALEYYLLASRYISGATNEQVVRLLRSTANGYNKVNEFDSGVRYYRKALSVLEETDNSNEIPKTLVDLAKTQSKKGDYSEAIKNGKRALALSREHKQEEYTLQSLVALSIVYRKISSYEDSLVNGLEALDIFQKNNNYSGIAASAHSIGLSYLHLNQIEKGKEYFTQVLNLPIDKINIKYRAKAFRDLARLFFLEKKEQKALDLNRESLAVFEQIGDQNGVATVQKNLGYYYFSMGNLRESQKAYTHAITLFQQLHDVWNEADSTAQLAIVLVELDLDKAFELAEKSLTLAKQIEVKLIIETAYNALVLIEEKRGNYKKALFYARKKEAIINEIKTDTVNKRSAEMYIILDVEKKERAFEVLKREKSVISLELENKKSKVSLLEKEKKINELQQQNTLIIITVSIVMVALTLLVLGRIYLHINYPFIVVMAVGVIFLLYQCLHFLFQQ